MAPIKSATLKNRHRAVRDAQPDSLRVRIHRSLSWLSRAEREEADPDARFLFLWIAFNAAYAHDYSGRENARNEVTRFLELLRGADARDQLQQVALEEFTGPVRLLIENRFVFEPYWKALREHDSSDSWERSFRASQRVALRAVLERDTTTVLSLVLDRLYVLRNQLVHGGSTWRGTANRAQVADGARILAALMPVILEIMIASRDLDFGQVAYPLIEA